jgi:hypothetical protein
LLKGRLKIMPNLDLYMNDIYPNMGRDNTNTIVQPDAEDQQALVDNEEIAQKVNSSTPNKSRVLGAIGILFAIALFMGAFSK